MKCLFSCIPVTFNHGHLDKFEPLKFFDSGQNACRFFPSLLLFKNALSMKASISLH